MSDLKSLRDLLPWLIVFTCAILAWIPILQQALPMLSSATPMFGSMGLTLGPFLWFWTLMMIAMMFPALAPTLGARYQPIRWQMGIASAFLHTLLFLSGYLAIWTLFGIPVFLLAQLGEQWMLFAPPWGLALGLGILLLAGVYQMTPLEKRFLRHCNPSCCEALRHSSARPLSAQWREGLAHGIFCVACCGCLMLVMVAVGLMNLPWMVLLTIVIFLEKTWDQGVRLSFFVGFSLLIFTMLAFAEPALLVGLYRPG